MDTGEYWRGVGVEQERERMSAALRQEAQTTREIERRARADRDAEWLAALAAEHRSFAGYVNRDGPSGTDALDNVAERMGLGEEFAARLKEGK